MLEHQPETGLRATPACGPVQLDVPPQRADWKVALASGDTRALLRLNAYHFARLPRFAPAFGDLRLELRFSGLPNAAQAAFIHEAVAILVKDGQEPGRQYCRRATTQLENDYARRHRPASMGGRHD
jgi:hypothetical protein